MKNLFKVFVVAFMVMASVGITSAQKVGHINLQELVTFMPDAKKANTELDTLQSTLLREIDRKTNEIKVKYDAYKGDMAKGTMLPSIQKTREDELNRLQTDLQSFQYQAQDDMDKKRTELFQPIIKKATDAINAVSKEKGYSYVLDSSAGTILFSTEGDDLMPSVKTKLGLK
ncbi:MAG: OmpH family outer membrane protein [Sphingobacteriales bacterium JAD_PAG50586_3]|nr:MAG: OmpH family outer membrane protein [Sphingobacteriales bacterium JAD_PAG50586_3]